MGLNSIKNMSEADQKLFKDYSQVRDHFKGQFEKAYFNVGIICDRFGDIKTAEIWYKKAIQKSFGDTWPDEPLHPTVSLTEHAIKAASNLAICLEKLGKRSRALMILEGLKDHLVETGAMQSTYI
jgi:tetratricopeptide (TPR) repeat protein